LRRSKVYSLSGSNYRWLQPKPLMIAACFQNFDLADARRLTTEINLR